MCSLLRLYLSIRPFSVGVAHEFNAGRHAQFPL